MMRRKPWLSVARAPAALAAVLALGACATKSDVRNLQLEVRGQLEALAARQDSLIAELFLEAASTQDTLRTQSDQIFDFRGQITQQLREIARGISTLEAIAGENQRGIASLRDQMANMRRAPVQPPPTLVDDTAAVGGPGSESLTGASGTAEQFWDVAREQHQRGSYGTAQAAYEDFLRQFANHPLAPDAQFFLADILERQDRPEDAIAAFQELQTLYPTAEKVPDALYRIAVLQRDAGDDEAAKATLERIVNTYPDATIALLARDLLEEIG